MALSSISIRKSLRNVSSDLYDKTNIFYYLLISAVVSILSTFIPEKPTVDNVSNVMVVVLLVVILSFLLNGIYTLAINQAIHSKNGVFPNPIKDISKIVIASIYTFLGNFVWVFVMMFVTSAVMVPMLFVNKIAAILVSAIPLFFIATIFIGAYFNFYNSLELADWFKVKKALHFFKQAKAYILPYLVKTIAIGVILFFITMAIFLITVPFSELQEPMVTAVSGIVAFIVTLIYCIATVYIVDLTAQFVQQAKKEEK